MKLQTILGTVLRTLFLIQLLIAVLLFGSLAFIVVWEGPQAMMAEYSLVMPAHLGALPYIFAWASVYPPLFCVWAVRAVWRYPKEPISRRLHIAAVVTVAFGVLLVLNGKLYPSQHGFSLTLGVACLMTGVIVLGLEMVRHRFV